MSSKVFRYTIQLDSNGDCAWTSEPAVSFDENSKVVILDPYQPIYDQVNLIKKQFPTTDVTGRLILLNDLFDLLIQNPEFFASFPDFARDINRDCWKLMRDKTMQPLHDKIYLIFTVSLCFI
jgi:hypothetical protein